MRVRTVAVAAVLLPALAVAAPVPKETDAEKIRRVYGTPDDPGKDCAFTLDGNKLVIHTSAAPHDYPFWGEVGKAPWVMRTVTGDFTATVRARGPANGVEGKRETDLPAMAGMFVGVGDGGLITRGQIVGNAVDRRFRWLKITRTGAEINFATSENGTVWNGVPLLPLGDGIPDVVTIGLFASNPSGLPFTAEFDEFTVTPLPAGGGKK